MTAKRIDGKAFAQSLTQNIARSTHDLLAATGIRPGLGVVLVGTDPASEVYVRTKSRQAEACGFKSVQETLPETATHEDVSDVIERLNQDPEIHGILVQLPLPSHLDADQIIQSVAAEKDVDGFHLLNVGRLSIGRLDTAFVPCTPAGCMMLLNDHFGSALSGLHAVVIGRSDIVGKPMAQLLLRANCTVTVAHSRSRDLPAICRSADILVAAAGRPEMVRGDWIKPGAVVIDVGINRITNSDGSSRLVGDVMALEVAEVASAITPVPGGVGPMTIASLLLNTLRAASRFHGVTLPALGPSKVASQKTAENLQ